MYGLGKGQSQNILAKENITEGQLFLRHVVNVANYVRVYFPQVQPLIWDDHMRWNVREQDIKVSNTSS